MTFIFSCQCDIQSDRGLGEGYQPRAQIAPTSTSIMILDITKTSSSNCLSSYSHKSRLFLTRVFDALDHRSTGLACTVKNKESRNHIVQIAGSISTRNLKGGGETPIRQGQDARRKADQYGRGSSFAWPKKEEAWLPVAVRERSPASRPDSKTEIRAFSLLLFHQVRLKDNYFDSWK